jgi:MFS family permease
MPDSERFKAFQYRDFRLFWTGQLISFSGTWMHATAQGWLVYSLTKSPFYLGMVSAASSLPILLFSLFGGAMADRFRKRNLLLLTQGLSIFPALLIGILANLGVITVWHVMALVFMLGTVNAFDIPTRQSFLIDMVKRGALLNAIALNSAAFNSARIIGPVLAGLIISTMGLPACFYINALSYVAVLMALSRISATGEKKVEHSNVLRDIYEGLRFVFKEPSLRRPMLLVTTFSLFGLPFIVLLPIFAEEILHVGVRGLGLLIGASGVGALASALFIAFRGDIKNKAGFMGMASIAFPLSLILFSMSKNYHLSLVLMVVAGLAVVAFLATANTTVQLKTPDRLRGRVMSLYTLVFLGMMPIGNSLMGSMAAIIGTASAVRLEASICLAVSLLIVFASTRK